MTFRFSKSSSQDLEFDPSRYTPAGNLIGPRERQIVLLGARGVGKSSICSRYKDEGFQPKYYPTIEDTFKKSVTFRGREFTLNILDTSGHDEFSILRPKIALVNGFIIQFSIDNPQSFYIAKKIKDKITNFLGPEFFPMVLIGNKSDLPRMVPLEEAKQLASDLKCPYIETSAKDNQNILKVFVCILEEIEKSMNPANPKPTNCWLM